MPGARHPGWCPVSRGKAKGTAWESLVVGYLVSLGWVHAERRALHGTLDRGDVAGLPGVVIECKNEKALSLAGWVDEAEVERANDGAEYGVVWHHRRGKGSPAQGYVTMSGDTFVRLLSAAGHAPSPVTESEKYSAILGADRHSGFATSAL